MTKFGVLFLSYVMGLSTGDFDRITLDNRADLPQDWWKMVNPRDPLDSSQFIDAVFDDLPPQFVTSVCILESGCYKPVGVHKGDTRTRTGRQVGRIVYERQKRWGKIDPSCPYYQPTGDREWYDRWSTVGNHGLMYGYQRGYIGTCFPMEWFDIPLVSALAAGRKARAICETLRKRKKKCTAEDLRIEWAQARSAKARRRVLQRWRRRLPKYKSYRNDVNWNNPPTLEDYIARTTLTPENNESHTP